MGGIIGVGCVILGESITCFSSSSSFFSVQKILGFFLEKVTENDEEEEEL